MLSTTSQRHSSLLGNQSTLTHLADAHAGSYNQVIHSYTCWANLVLTPLIRIRHTGRSKCSLRREKRRRRIDTRIFCLSLLLVDRFFPTLCLLFAPLQARSNFGSKGRALWIGAGKGPRRLQECFVGLELL